MRSQSFNRVNGGQQPYALSYARPMQELRVINDDVMGGGSRSKLLPTATGLLSNDGGFASCRAPLRLPPDVVALPVAVRGGNRRYRFVLRTDEDSGTAQYQAPFVAPPLQLADVRAFGLLIGEGPCGSFRVELELPRAG